MKIYLQVSKDKYELPIAVASSIKELSQICGVSEDCIRSGLSKVKRGRIKKSSYVCVDIDN